ncbi:MAG: hypothetical protein JO022_21380 [Acidobacteriaceae bacterium]|nr:hypothetical protein [Acidobacteriaceae bacterium]
MPAKVASADTLDKWSACLKDAILGPKILAEAKKTRTMENVEFLNAMKVGDKKQTAYDKYIKESSARQVNISDRLRTKFDDVAKSPKPDWSKAPWGDATKEILNLVRDNFKHLDQ